MVAVRYRGLGHGHPSAGSACANPASSIVIAAHLLRREVTHRSRRLRPAAGARAAANTPRLRRIPLTTATIGSAEIILRSSTACSVTRYLPRSGGFMHRLASLVIRGGRRIRWSAIRANEVPG